MPCRPGQLDPTLWLRVIIWLDYRGIRNRTIAKNPSVGRIHGMARCRQPGFNLQNNAPDCIVIAAGDNQGTTALRAAVLRRSNA